MLAHAPEVEVAHSLLNAGEDRKQACGAWHTAYGVDFTLPHLAQRNTRQDVWTCDAPCLLEPDMLITAQLIQSLESVTV